MEKNKDYEKSVKNIKFVYFLFACLNLYNSICLDNLGKQLYWFENIEWENILIWRKNFALISIYLFNI